MSTEGREQRLVDALNAGWNLSQFARAEGVSRQAIDNWIDRRPEFRARLGNRLVRCKITPKEFARRAMAIKARQDGELWKVAAWRVGLSASALAEWYRINREAVDRFLTSDVSRIAA